MDRDFIIQDYDRTEGNTYILFNHSSNRKENILLNIDFTKKDTQFYRFFNLVPMTINEFKVINDKGSIIIGGYFNYRPLVVLYNLGTNRPSVLPGYFNTFGTLMELILNKDNTFEVIVQNRVDKTTQTRVLKYNSEGLLLNTHTLKESEGFNILNAKMYTSKEGHKFISGTYGRNRSLYSQGIFVLKIEDDNKEQNITHVPFHELNNYFNFYPERRKNRILDRIDRRKENNRKIRINYKMIVQNLVEYNNGFQLLCESYYPQYKSINNGFFYGSNINRSLIFDGYKYTHSLLVTFDKNGQQQWNHSIPIKNLVKFNLEPAVKISWQSSRTDMLYLSKNFIHSTSIKDGEIVLKTDTELTSLHIDDIIKNSGNTTSEIDYWFGNYFISSGIQHIKNYSDSNISHNRAVFYLNKVKVGSGE